MSALKAIFIFHPIAKVDDGSNCPSECVNDSDFRGAAPVELAGFIRKPEEKGKPTEKGGAVVPLHACCKERLKTSRKHVRGRLHLLFLERRVDKKLHRQSQQKRIARE